MRVAKLLGRLCASISASLAEATLPILVPYSIHTIILARQVAHPVAALHLSWLGNAIWPSGGTRVVPFRYPAPGVEPTGSKQTMGVARIPGASPFNSSADV